MSVIFVFRNLLCYKLGSKLSQLKCFIFFMSGPFKADHTVCFVLIDEGRTVAFYCLHQLYLNLGG